MKDVIQIKVSTTVRADRKKVWDYYTQTSHITHWNFASEDWHCPNAENDLRVGGIYKARMEAKDSSMGFDFEAQYDEVIDKQKISYTMTDGRKATTTFKENNGSTTVETTFDAENTHSIDMQRDGWQAILNNFKKYTEAS